jgi:hypothetical protein
VGKDLKCFKKLIVFIILDSSLTTVDLNFDFLMMNYFDLIIFIRFK